MLVRGLSSTRTFLHGRSIQWIRNRYIKNSAQTLRHKSAVPHISKPINKRTIYPERFIVYHAGTGRTVFLGCLKVTTIFIFSFFCLVVAPTHFYAEEEPTWVSGAVVLSGIIPMVFVAYITKPYVTYIHLRLPAFVRNSRELLIKFSKNLPKDAELDITTMNFIGKPRVTRVKLFELNAVHERFGMANYARDTTSANSKRPWWMGKAVRQFGVHSGRSKIMGDEVWANITQRIGER